jgi:single-strand DNA-binding protein
MSTRTITGNLATDPEVVLVGGNQITKLRVIENQADYREGEWHSHDDPTTHFIEARFDLGSNVAASLHRGDAVIVVGHEHTSRWGSEDGDNFGRVIEADNIGADLGDAVADIHIVGESAS